MGKNKKELKKGSISVLNPNKYFYLILLIVPALLYIHCMDYSYTSMDDEQILKNNASFMKDINNIPEAFKVDAFIQKNASSLYRPLQTITYIIDYQFVKKDDSLKPFHITNLILNCMVMLLLFNLLLRLRIERITAFLLMLLFSVHPLLTAAIVWIPSRGDLLLAFFTLISLITFIKYKENNKLYYLLLNILAFFLALLSKETAILIPLLILGVDFIVYKNKILSKGNLIAGGVWCTVIILYLIVRNYGLNAPTLPNDVLGIKPFIENLPLIPIIAGKFFIPNDLTTYAMFKTYSVIIGCFIMAGSFVLLFKMKRNRIPAMLGWLWFLLSIVPPMIFRHQFSKYGTDYIEHRAYLPAVGLLIFAAFVIEEYLSGKSKAERTIYLKKPGIVSLYAGLFIFFTYSAYNHSLDYKDHLAFSNSSIESCDRNAIGYGDRATVRIAAGDFTEALHDLDKAIELCPNYYEAYNNRAVIYLNLNQPDKALNYSSISIKMNKDYSPAYLTRGSAEIRLKMYKEAIEDFNFVVSKEPRLSSGYYDRAVAYELLGNDNSALQDYLVVARLEPDNNEIQNKIVEIRGKLSKK